MCIRDSDYSAQEPRLTVHLAQDEKGIQAYIDGKDLYAEIASLDVYKRQTFKFIKCNSSEMYKFFGRERFDSKK